MTRDDLIEQLARALFFQFAGQGLVDVWDMERWQRDAEALLPIIDEYVADECIRRSE